MLRLVNRPGRPGLSLREIEAILLDTPLKSIVTDEMCTHYEWECGCRARDYGSSGFSFPAWCDSHEPS